jgi:hypothetical protein|mmetsp:Transcript_51074/g.79764  ORF Transcript_51074/g.79764 Transcript_51074/m.79764 type:complete len:272 (-) Transcript_51074:81-896(-)
MACLASSLFFVILSSFADTSTRCAVITAEQPVSTDHVASHLMRRSIPTETTAVHIGSGDQTVFVESTRSKRFMNDDSCIDFPLGEVGKTCEESGYAQIQDHLICKEAADLAHMGWQAANNLWEINAEYEQVRPKGCFKFPCSNQFSASGMCYYHNYVSGTPSGPISASATPVCRRPRFVNGSAPESATVCPDEYEPITVEGICETAGICRQAPFPPNQQRRINEVETNAAVKYPHGCLQKAAPNNDRVWFNAPNNEFAPSSPSGTPICVAK